MTSKLTREQLHERARDNVKALKMASRQTAFESVREEILADLQLAELALSTMDSEPYGFTDGDRRGMIYEPQYADRLKEPLPVYRHAQPAPVVGYVPLGDSPYDIPYSMPSNLREFIDQEIGILFSDDDAQGVWIACRRAAMLAPAQQEVPDGK